MFKLDETIVQKVLDTIKPGLSSGLGVQEPGNMCVEAAVCYALGLPHGDDPGCVSSPLRTFKIRINDSNWSSPQARAKGLRRLAIAQLGTKNTLDDIKFVAELAKLAKKWAYADTAAAAYAADTAAAYAADTAAAYAADTAAAYAVYAADTAAAYAVTAAAYAADTAAAYAAAAAAYAARDKVLSDACEDVVQLLISMNAPGTKYLYLTEK